ncbi:MAG: dihydrofolate reductase family protein [Candidatus Bathyarchaeia archaeon]
MRKIVVFNYVSVDGFFAGPNGEMDLFLNISKDHEFNSFVDEGSKSGGALIFGRRTYEVMKSYWPTPDAIENNPGMAEVMNNIPKIVFSKTLQRVDEEPYWKNITLFHEIKAEEIVKLKEQEGKGITILGSGTIVQQLANFGLIDEYQLLVVPVVLGVGKSLFKDVKKMNLKLLDARTFGNGIVLLRYQPIK